MFLVSTLQQLYQLRCCRLERCTCRTNTRFECWPCRRLRQKMCQAYHAADSAAVELAGRIAYEVVFDMLDVRTVDTGLWLNTQYRCDHGHTVRLQLLAKRVMAKQKDSRVCAWLNVRAALKNM